MTHTIKKVSTLTALICAGTLLTACGSGGSGGGSGGDSGGNGVIVGGNGSGNGNGIPNDPPAFVGPNFTVTLDPAVVAASSDFFIESYNSYFGDVVNPLNAVPMALSATVPITYTSCNRINAFYSLTNKDITLCAELGNFIYGNLLDEGASESLAFQITFETLAFVLYHEVGHAVDDLLNLPIAGNVESAADAIATVFSIESGNSVFGIRGALFFRNEPDSFADEHGGGEDRSGDVFCWTIGGDSALLFNPQLANIVSQFIQAGRDCTAEYQGQRASVLQWLPGFGQLKRKTWAPLNLDDAGGQLTLKQLQEVSP